MDTNIDILAAEISRIVDSPYPTQLKTLHDIVSGTTDDHVCLWAKLYTCRIPFLVQALIDALPHWPYVFTIIIRLSCAAEIRDAVLHQEPTLLGHVVGKAVEAQAGSKKYLDLSVALLCRPLPKEITLPAATQTLLIQLFEQAAAQPDESTVKPIFLLLRGSCRQLISVLPFGTLANLEDRLMSIMRALTSVQIKTAAMYCLSVMRTILDELASSSQSTPTDIWEDLDCSNANSSAGDRWKPNALAHLFQGSRGLKILSLITLQVIWACTPGTEKSEPEATLASCVIANDVLCAISSTDREEWYKQNGAPILRKLQDRCLVPDLSPALRFQALTFFSSIAEKFAMPPQHVSGYEQMLLEFASLPMSTEHLEHALQASLPRFAPMFNSQWWEAFVSNTLDMLLEPQALTLVCHSAAVTKQSESLIDVVSDSSECRQGLILAVSSFRCRQKADRFLNSSTPQATPSDGTAGCRRKVATCLSMISTSFCSLLLRGALAAQPNEVQLPSNLIPGILRRHASFDYNNIACQTCDQRPHRSLSGALFVEVESTPDTQRMPLPWKEKLAARMQAQAKNQQEAMIASFAEICRDLEERCESVEAPLRQEHDKYLELQSRYEQLNISYGELEAQVMDRDLRINVLEAESDSCNAQLETVSAESQDLLEKLERSAKELQEANENAKRAMDSFRQEKHEHELEYATTMACKQEALDEARDEVQRCHHELEDLRSQLGQLEEGGKQNDVRHERLQTEIQHLERQIQEGQTHLAQIEEDKRAVMEKHTSLQQESIKTRENNSTLQRQNEDLRSDLENFKAESKREMDRAVLSFEDSMTTHREEWTRINSGLEQQLEQARQDLTQAEDSFHAQQELKKQKTTELRKKIDRLSKECHKKDAQIAEAQEMRNRLMSAMGFAGAMPPGMGMPPATTGTFQEPSTISSALPYRSASTMATPKPTSLPVVSTPAQNHEEQGIEEEDDSLASDASSDHGPTPKRARPRQSVGRNSVHQPRQSIGSRTVRSVLRNRSVAKRGPLLDMDVNRSPGKSARSPSKVAFKNVERQAPVVSTGERKDMEDWSFSNADILTGTPGLGLKDRMDYMDEESTADVM